MKRKTTFWLGLFTGTSWNQYLSSDNPQVGFNQNQIKQAQKIIPGDKIIAYLTKVGSFVGILEASDFAIVSEEEKWSEGLFPVSVKAKPTIKVPIPHALPIRSLLGELSFSKDGNSKLHMHGAYMFDLRLGSGKVKMVY